MSNDQQMSEISFRTKLLMLTLLSVQYSTIALVGRYTRASVSTEDAFVVNQFVLVTECCKLLASTLLEYRATGGHLADSINDHIIKKSGEFLKMSIPAFLYVIQNTLIYVGLSNLSAPVFQVIHQLKLVTTAIVSVLLLNRRYKVRQWICLVALGIGVSIVVLDGRSSINDTHQTLSQINMDPNIITGLSAVVCSCFSSAIAGVYFEKKLKIPGDEKSLNHPPSLWMRNIQLAFFSVCIAHGKMTTTIESKPFLHGFTKWVWFLVLLQAGYGLLIAAVIKYADNVVKGLATGISIIFSTLVSSIVFHTDLSIGFGVGSTIIISSVYFFSNEFAFGRMEISKESNTLPT